MPREIKHRKFKIGSDDKALIEKLQPSYQEILASSQKHGGNTAAMATALDINVGTAKSRLHRARTALEAARHAG